MRIARTALLALAAGCISHRTPGPVEYRRPERLGAEDITLDRTAGVALISCDPRRPADPARRPQGAIYAYDLGAGRPVLRNLTAGLAIPFHPHGIGLYCGPGGQKRLFVVNHRSACDHTVEIFDYEDGRLEHRRAMRSPGLMHSPNDVVPVSPDAFYVTNSQGARSGFGRLFEALTGWPRSYVLYCDAAGELRKVAERLAYVNGINVSADGSRVYATTSLGRELHAFERDAATGDLREVQRVRLGSMGDNVELDEDGSLWIGAHPRKWSFFFYGIGWKKRSPSEVLHVPLRPDGSLGEPETVFQSRGCDLPASSVATRHGDTLLVGSVFDGFLEIELR